MQGYDGNGSRNVTLFKTPQTTIPRILLIHLASDRQQSVTPATAPKIIMRKRSAPRPNGGEARGNAGSDSKTTRSMQDRERAYAEARARIFGEDSNSSSSVASNDEQDAKRNASDGKLGSHHASGPDGTKGFHRPARGDEASARNRSQSPETSNAETCSSRNHGQPTRRSSPNANSKSSNDTPKGQNWKESKVLWRNREQELNDPDFTRNHDMYRPNSTMNRAPGNNYTSNARYGRPGPSAGRFGPPQHQTEFYDQQRAAFGYSAPQGPPFGRRMHPGDYSRLESARAPPPPPDYFRQCPPQQMPPPPPGAMAGRMARFPPPREGLPSGRLPSADPASGGYNDEFPPLGK